MKPIIFTANGRPLRPRIGFLRDFREVGWDDADAIAGQYVPCEINRMEDTPEVCHPRPIPTGNRQR